ncbi:hypothetical protein [Formosimonas limnophila]|uniref:hypothetical protein n=1 Tax=Formosimonas limnophila TaxID=1384487 RepID=UPI00167854FB|nr:hypothetical protein [Formosimonas limnophila]
MPPTAQSSPAVASVLLESHQYWPPSTQSHFYQITEEVVKAAVSPVQEALRNPNKTQTK